MYKIGHVFSRIDHTVSYSFISYSSYSSYGERLLYCMNSNKFAGMFLSVSFLSMGLFPFFPAKNNLPTVHQSQLSWHEVLHTPIVNGKKIEATAYLTLPFRRSDVKVPYNIYQGFIYSADELKIHGGNPVHGGIDYHLPYGTPIVAPADGYATSSYLSTWVKDEETRQTKLYQGKPIRYGFGYFVRMYIPSTDRYLDIAHMSDVDSAVPFSPPEKKEDGWYPTKYDMKTDEWKSSPNAVFVKKGSIIGAVGYSGLGWGTEEEWHEGATRPVVTDPTVFKSWDKPHIHFEEFSIDQEKGIKGWQRDPYAIYDTYDYYPTPTRHTTMGKDPLFYVGTDALPKYADD